MNPSSNDPVTIPCPVCATPFVPAGKCRYCRVAAHRRRTRTIEATVAVVPPPRRLRTVYECDTCGTRLLGTQRCDDCGTCMRRVGPGGQCPCCDEPVTIEELLTR
jgi:hypothetical protein